ncbi:MAG TPA: acyl-CoA dehydrogenase family protein, partial [Deinococcales bacterium]|nr:acyl-CoA dehydrogenase family protein [Deinococcales bacterium]
MTTATLAGKQDWIEVARTVGPRFAADAARHDAENSFVAENYPVLRESGLLSALVPEELGGGGATHAEVASVIRELAQHCPATALALSMHQHLLAAAVWRYRRGQPGEALLRRVAAENLVLVSTGAGDWLSSSGQAERVEGGFRVTARKGFASGCEAGDLLLTSAPYLDPSDGPTVLHFAVPLSAPGVSIERDWMTLGMRGTGSHTVVMDGVLVA